MVHLDRRSVFSGQNGRGASANGMLSVLRLSQMKSDDSEPTSHSPHVAACKHNLGPRLHRHRTADFLLYA
eukprot:3650502-Prymnesium_polylepis.1